MILIACIIDDHGNVLDVATREVKGVVDLQKVVAQG